MVVGITGSIASGKSLVTTYLINKGYKVIDSDKISHEVLFINEVKQRLINQFGSTIITNNEINRKELGFIVFNDNNKKEKLQNIVFPYILEEIKKQISNNKGLIFLDAPLLIEYNIMYLVDKIIVVKANKEVQVKRLMDRDNIFYEYAIKKIESQLPIEEKEKYADYIIDNSSDINNTYNQIENILKQMED